MVTLVPVKHRAFRLAPVMGLLFANAASAEGGIPQMDQTWYPNQLLWLAISFGLLFIVVSRFIAPTISRVLSARENAISEAIQEAEKAKREAESTSGNAESASQTARIRAAEVMAKAHAENTKDAATALAKLDHEIERKADHAEAVLRDAMKHAQAGVEEAARELAQVITEKLLGDAASAEATGPKLKLAVKR